MTTLTGIDLTLSRGEEAEYCAARVRELRAFTHQLSRIIREQQDTISEQREMILDQQFAIAALQRHVDVLKHAGEDVAWRWHDAVETAD